MYKRLHLDKVTATITRLEARIGERFPESGLRVVCQELINLASGSKVRIDWVSKPNIGIRLGVAMVILAAAFLFWFTVVALGLEIRLPRSNDIVMLVDSLLNTFVLVGASVFFLITLETRIKRSRALSALHELRAIAHVIDMHQLTKDPSFALGGDGPTPSSPQRNFTPYQLRRYLDYCAEMLSLVGKLAAIYSQKLPDPEIVTAANEIENLCASLSRKIWQKIQLLDS